MKFVHTRSCLAPGLDELSIFGKLRNAIVACSAARVSFGHEDVSIGSNGNVRGLVEEAGLRAGYPGLTQRHEDLPLRTEFENLISLSVVYPCIGHPQVPLSINGGTVRKDEHAFAPTLEQLPVSVEFENW